MSNFVVTGALASPQKIDATSATQEFPLGTIVTAHDIASTDYGSGEFIYAVGVASTVVGSVVIIDTGDYVTALAAANGVGIIGAAMSINTAGRYGWYQISGRGVVKGLASLADAKLCYLTATAGSVDDAVVAGDAIHFMETTSALDTPSTGLAEVNMSRPFVTNESN
jgi:hypothetical protein